MLYAVSEQIQNIKCLKDKKRENSININKNQTQKIVSVFFHFTMSKVFPTMNNVKKKEHQEFPTHFYYFKF